MCHGYNLVPPVDWRERLGEVKVREEERPSKDPEAYDKPFI